MRRFVIAIRRLWLLATCNHANCGRCIEWDDTTSITVCHRCNQVMSLVICEADRGRYGEASALAHKDRILSQAAERRRNDRRYRRDRHRRTSEVEGHP